MLFLASCAKEETLFSLVSPETSNITFQNTLTPNEDVNILDYLYFYNGGGVAAGDVNGDGLADLYFTGNQVPNKLYLNQGGLVFKDVTDQAGVAGNSDWNTGTVMADVNGDGWLDIYVCAVVGINGFYGQNELFINQGDGTFKEEAAKYGLDLDNYSSTAAFFDYDRDGDLDMYLLNHAVHSQESFGRFDIRFRRSYESGDKLLRNDNNSFVDVSEQARIYGGANGYGLGLAISDFNNDGWPDIYVGNDFHEDDYFYLNNGDGTFTESLKTYFGHTSRFSMGNDVADINHDGYPDILSLDMLPEDEKVLKSSVGDDNVAMQEMRIDRLGYHYQYSRNMLQINNKGRNFTETALLSGLAATDWSWGALFGDYDLDGEQDVFVSNGIPRRPNDLDYIKYISNEQIQKKIQKTKLVDQEALDLMPDGAVSNYIFKGEDGIRFENTSGQWLPELPSYSNGCAYADLDNDGDLDLVTNDINNPPLVYRNDQQTAHHYLKVNVTLPIKNSFGMGAKAVVYYNGKEQTKELFTARGFQSSSEPVLHFGLGTNDQVDSLKVQFPNGSMQVFKDVKVDRTLTIRSIGNTSKEIRPSRVVEPLFKRRDSILTHTHRENGFNDFNRQKLIPYKISDRGPAVAVGDYNGDGRQDVFLGGARGQASVVFFQQEEGFVQDTLAGHDSTIEDVAAKAIDMPNNKADLLVIAAGGGEFYRHMPQVLDKASSYTEGGFAEIPFPELFETSSVVRTADFDEDGDMDIFIGSNAVSYDFGALPNAYLLRDDQGKFTPIQQETFQKVGMVTDAIFTDYDDDDDKDLILVGEWMAPRFFKNDKGTFSSDDRLRNLNGLYRSIQPFDMETDGDTDYLLGNWGTNTKFKASKDAPIRMYYGDFDDNGQTETIVAVEKEGTYYPILGLNELSSQLESLLKKKFTQHRNFAGLPLEEVFETDVLRKGTVLEVHNLASGYLRNDKGTFSFVPFSDELQVSPITAICIEDFDKDGRPEALLGGNYFGVTPYHGRFDSFSGALLKANSDVILGSDLGLEIFGKAIRSMDLLEIEGRKHLLITINDDEAQLYEMVQ